MTYKIDSRDDNLKVYATWKIMGWELLRFEYFVLGLEEEGLENKYIGFKVWRFKLLIGFV